MKETIQLKKHNKIRKTRRLIIETTKRAWINGLFLAVTVVINTLSAFGLISGLSQKEVSDMFTTLITPSSSAFRIWSVIYSLLIISVIVMIIKKDTPYYKSAINQITALFRISCILNIAWIIAFSDVQIELSVLFIFGFVITLSLICQQLLKINDGKHWLTQCLMKLFNHSVNLKNLSCILIAAVITVGQAG